MGFLASKRILITGMISTRSIAYGIAQAMHRESAEPAFTYQGERVRGRVEDMAMEFDGFVHSIAYAPREALDGEFLDGFSREAFRVAHDISAYSFPAMAKAALPMMEGRNAAAFLCSNLANSITGEITYVDGGFNTTSLGSTEA